MPQQSYRDRGADQRVAGGGGADRLHHGVPRGRRNPRYGLIGALLGLLLAGPYATLAVLAVGEHAPVTFPTGQLLLVAVALTGATALAGLLPADRAARVSPVTALAAGD
ncbi:hypothetical protein GCM10012279_19570 [Micromonospora yangpuensis]|nr:hypothetical protein GCM10012279_19570 [Micromonospora yangpuensis]